jgi:hypothetical protein
MVRRAVVDARNCLDPMLAVRAGFDYEGIGIAGSNQAIANRLGEEVTPFRLNKKPME